MPSIREVAALAGVSPATVSRVMNGTAKVDDEKKARVLRAIDETGFIPNEVARTLFRKVCDMHLAAAFKSIRDKTKEPRFYRGSHGGELGICSRLRPRSGSALTVHQTVIHCRPVQIPSGQNKRTSILSRF